MLVRHAILRRPVGRFLEDGGEIMEILDENRNRLLVQRSHRSCYFSLLGGVRTTALIVMWNVYLNLEQIRKRRLCLALKVHWLSLSGLSAA